jgi:hypothetical protein
VVIRGAESPLRLEVMHWNKGKAPGIRKGERLTKRDEKRLIFNSKITACSDVSQSKNFYYCTYSHTPSISWTFPLCNAGYYNNTTTTWWYDLYNSSGHFWTTHYVEGTSFNNSKYYTIGGYSIYFWAHGAWTQYTNFNLSIPPYATLDTGMLLTAMPLPGGGYVFPVESFGDYYSTNFTILTSNSTNYTLYQEVYPYSN